jgi:hypothetical protein
MIQLKTTDGQAKKALQSLYHGVLSLRSPQIDQSCKGILRDRWLASVPMARRSAHREQEFLHETFGAEKQ